MTVHHEVANFGEVLNEAEAINSTRWKGAYVEGKRHGAWKAALSNGHAIEENYERGRLHGPYEARDSDGSAPVSANLVDGEVGEIRLPQAALPLWEDGDSDRSPVAGGFGITFGPDLEQLRPLMCSGSSCIGDAFWRLTRAVETSFQNTIGANLWVTNNVPNPIPRGKTYEITVSAWIGISGVSAELWFESVEAARMEAVRINGLLREKYGQCRDYRHEIDSELREPAGQCDANGLPVAVVSTHLSGDLLELKYRILDSTEREAVVAAWQDKREVRASDL